MTWHPSSQTPPPSPPPHLSNNPPIPHLLLHILKINTCRAVIAADATWWQIELSLENEKFRYCSDLNFSFSKLNSSCHHVASAAITAKCVYSWFLEVWVKTTFNLNCQEPWHTNFCGALQEELEVEAEQGWTWPLYAWVNHGQGLWLWPLMSKQTMDKVSDQNPEKLLIFYFI